MMVRGWVSEGQVRSQVLLVQLTEQEPVQMMWQVALEQLTLLLGPTVSEQVLPSVQLALQDSPQVPPQDPSAGHCSEQLSLFSEQPLAWDQPESPEPQAERTSIRTAESSGRAVWIIGG